MTSLTWITLTAAFLASPSATAPTGVASQAAKAAACPLPCAVECVAPVASADCDPACCDVPCAADAEAVAAK